MRVGLFLLISLLIVGLTFWLLTSSSHISAPNQIVEPQCLEETSVERAPPQITQEDRLRLDREWEVHVISGRGGGPDGVRFVDVNNDGLCDVVTAYEHSGKVKIFQHPGYELVDEPWEHVSVGVVPRGEDAMGMDADGDGVIDIVSSHEGDTLGIYVHWGPTDPESYMEPKAWGEPVLLSKPPGRGWMFAIPMDVNDDQHIDIVAGSKDDYYNDRNSVGDLGWFENPGHDKRDLENWDYHSIDHMGWTMSIIPFDVNGDGNMDLIVTDRNADEDHMGARWLRNPGANWEQPWKSKFLGDLAGTSPTFMAIGDLNSDGLDELVIPLVDRNKIVILARNILGEPGEYKAYDVNYKAGHQLGTLKAVAITDVDFDGRNDIVISYVGGQVGLAWISFNDDPFRGPWSFHVISTVDHGKFDIVQLYDVDGDGDKDILTTEEVLGLGVLWFENPVIELGPKKIQE